MKNKKLREFLDKFPDEAEISLGIWNGQDWEVEEISSFSVNFSADDGEGFQIEIRGAIEG